MHIGSKKLKDGAKKRKLGRNPRVPFTQHQVSLLEQKFSHTHYLSSIDVAELSSALNLTENRVSSSHLLIQFIGKSELNWTDLFSEKNTGCTGQEEMPLTYTLQKQKVQSKLEHE